MAEQFQLTATQKWYGVEYEIDLEQVRRAMVACHSQLISSGSHQTYGKVGPGIEYHANKAGVSHMTFRRLLTCKSVSLDSTVKILTSLGLKFEDVCSPRAMATA